MEQPIHEQYIEVLKRHTTKSPNVVDNSYYNCSGLPCFLCPYDKLPCGDIRVVNFKQTKDYHLRTYPEDFL